MIYVHVPFCKSFCTYCDFYSEICTEKVQNLFLSSLYGEILTRRDEIRRALEPRTLYIGGGTPSVLPAAAISEIVRRLDAGPYEEFTVEVNPDDVTPAYAAALAAAGVNRVSMGVQSFDDALLRWMNRRHVAAGARAAFAALRAAGIRNVSIDLIFGISQLSQAQWRRTVEEALELRPEHISAYQLSVESGSALARMVREGRYAEASEDHCRAQYDTLCALLGAAGYHHYEISNFALPGYEARHNAAYWRRVPYVGLGPGAHSFDGRVRSWNSGTLPDWTRTGETLSESEAREEAVMLGLRTDAGIPASLVDAAAAAPLLQAGALIQDQGRLRIPEDHFFVCDDIIASLI